MRVQVVPALLLGLALPAQDPESLRALLDTRVEVATQYAMSARESPGIISLLRREDIEASGARDLMELLRLVPGLAFAADTQGVVGIGVRTLWGHDGKVLLLVDGQEMNEPLYGTLAFGGHYPLGNVDRIEIIRGPGSVLYGGFAELAVIHVITRKGAEVDGLAGDFWGGRMAGADQTRLQGQVIAGKAWGGQDLSVSVSRAMMPTASGPWPTAAGVIDAGAEAKIARTSLNVGYGFEGLNVRFIHDAYAVRDYTLEAKPGIAWLTFPSDFLGLDYAWTSGGWTLQPRFSVKGQSPWNYTDARTDRNTRLVGGVSALWAASPTLRLSLGVEGTQDDSNIYWSALGRRQHYVYENRASTTQILWSPGFGNLDLGVRHDQNSEYGSATSPRLAFTKATDRWHVKFLVAGAFRAPSIENLFVNPDLRPERTLSYEAEAGHTLAPGYYLSANLFFMRVHDPISYAISPSGKNTYLNFDYTGAEGVELQLKGRHPTFTVEASLSYARARDHQAEFYRVEGREDAHVGFPALSATGRVQWRFAEGWSFNPSLRLLGTRYGYRRGETRATAFGRCALLDLYLVRTFGDHFRGGLLVSNALDADQPVLQAYGTPGVGGSPPLPGARREVDLRVSFRF